MKIDNFFSELKRRNVYKVAVAYAVVSWLVVQAASILFPTFDAPAWVMKVLVALIALGFPAALIFSWAFEITPEGIKRESEISPNESITRTTGRKIVAITVVIAAIAGGLFVFQFIRADRHLHQQAVLRLTKTLLPCSLSPISATTKAANIFRTALAKSC